MNNEVVFFQKVSEVRVTLSDQGRGSAFPQRVKLYLNTAAEFAKVLGVKGFPLKPIEWMDQLSSEEAVEKLMILEGFVRLIQARNIYELDGNLKRSLIELDESWKSTISGHLERVRDIVRRAEIEESMRERIFSAIQALQTEVERNRTRVDAVVSVWLQITEAIGGGAKNLEPAAKLVEKLTRALYRAKDAEQRPQLPPPPKELSESDPSETSSA